ncbi:MAG: hypothetical protein M3O91_05035 [Chloroflexota bacterium]|nr:hypothetical protein [Chloroflexota bacterium]
MLPAFAWFVRNFLSSDVAVHRRVALVVRNVWIRAVQRQACCGHPGEPGC